MADILPFRGLRYNTTAPGITLADVVAPPYDVISPTEQAQLYEKSPYNVVRLILGREPDRYACAAALFAEWQGSGILVPDDTPSVYVYRQTFADPLTGKPAPERVGLVCLLKLEEYASGKVLPHEKTLSAPKTDRMELLRATRAQFESIYGLYSDPDSSVQSFLQEYDDREMVMERVENAIGSSHAIERIRDSSAVATLRELLSDKPIFIADGHHRYETALQYRRESGLPGAGYIFVTLTAFEDEGLQVLPTHRLVRGVDADRLAGLLTALSPQFAVTSAAPEQLTEAIAEEAKMGRKALGIVLPGGHTYLATLATLLADIPAAVPGPGSDALKRLDVTILHRLVLESVLGITPEAVAAGGQIAYTRDADEAFRRVQDGEYQAAFLLARPTVADVRDVSLAGDTMPQKSTFFYPKLLSGLLLRDLALDNPAEALRSDAE